jgi:hypothetical protein
MTQIKPHYLFFYCLLLKIILYCIQRTQLKLKHESSKERRKEFGLDRPCCIYYQAEDEAEKAAAVDAAEAVDAVDVVLLLLLWLLLMQL